MNTGIKSALEKRCAWGGAGMQEGGDICILVADLHCCLAKTNTTLQSNFPPIKKKSALGRLNNAQCQNVKMCCCQVKILRLFNLLMYYCSCFVAAV